MASINVTKLGQVIKLGNLAAAPSAPEAGMIYYDTVATKFKFYQNGAWVDLSAGSYSDPLTTRGDLLVRNATITTRLALGTTSYVLMSDGTDAVYGQIVNASVAAAAGIQESKLTLDYSTSSLNSAIGGKLSLTGGTMSGAIAMGNNKITGLAAPTANGDALRYDMLGANSGIATLDGTGKVPAAQLPNSVMEYKGSWNATTNSPTLADGTGNAGDVYRCSVAGTQNLGSGSITFAIGDFVIYSGSIWEKSPMASGVVSVNSQTGIVTLYTDDISEDGSPTNLWFTGARARSTVLTGLSAATGGTLAATDTILEAFGKLEFRVALDDAKVSYSASTARSDLIASSIVDGVTDHAPDSNSVFDALALKSDTTHNHDLTYLGIAATAADSSKLNGQSASYYATATALADKANKALDNLASVAINTSLVSDTNNTDDLGSSSIAWKDLYLAGALVGSSLKRGATNTNVVTETYVHSSALTASTTAVCTDLTFAHATYKAMIVDYMIKEATSGEVRTGKLFVATDGTDVSISDMYSETADITTSWAGAINGTDVELSYTTGANAKTARFDKKLFLA
jgi:hypothetical protein